MDDYVMLELMYRKSCRILFTTVDVECKACFVLCESQNENNANLSAAKYSQPEISGMKTVLINVITTYGKWCAFRPLIANIEKCCSIFVIDNARYSVSHTRRPATDPTPYIILSFSIIPHDSI